MRRLLPLLLACTATASAQNAVKTVPFQWQHAIITKVAGSAPAYTLTLDYVDLFRLDSIEDYDRARKMGVVKNLAEFRKLADQAPSGLFIRNINPKLRTLKTDARTRYQLVCLNKPDQSLLVDARTFMKALNGATVPGCWPMDRTVQLMLQGDRIEQISQVYFP